MSQFGGGKPPGQWGRPAPPGGAPQIAGFPTVNVGGFPMVNMGGMGVPMGMVNQAAFSSQSMLGMQGIMGAVPQQSIAQQTAVRSQPVQQVAGNGLQPNASAAKNQRTFVGVVTKMLDTYGFVDDDVFFQHSVIRGAHPRVGDKVMVEANYNPAMPFKWNAYRIQLLNATAQAQPEPTRQQAPTHQNVQPARGGGGNNDSSRWGSSSQAERNGRDSPAHRNPPRRHSPPRRSPPRRATSPKRDSASNRGRDSRDTRRSSPPRRSPPRRASPPPASSRSDRNERKRERSPSGSVAPSLRRDSASPPRRRARIIPRYDCRLPKPVLLSEIISGSTLRHRYNKLYLPSDYVDLTFNWVRNVQLDYQLDLNNAIQFHVLHKDVEIPLAEGESLPEVEPEDADHRHQVKVCLLSHLGKVDVVKKSFCLMADGSTDDHQEPQSLWKNLSFLVGVRGKETMAIGGSWSPSLDGTDPKSPATMIKTAIRTTKALTGIDLSSVSQWFSMVQVRYYRADKQRVDHINLLFPDTQQLLVSDEQWASTEAALLEQLKVKLEAIDSLKIEEEVPVAVEEPAMDEKTAVVVVDEVVEQVDEHPQGKEEEKESADNLREETNDVSMTSETEEEKSATTDGVKNEPSGPTNWKLLDAKSMKVAELRVELEWRGLETKGIKTLLVQRLQAALDAEKAAEAKDDEMKEVDNKVKAEPSEENPAAFIAPPIEETRAKSEAEAKKEAEEAEKRKKKEEELEKEKKEKKEQLDKAYQLPKDKKILVYPSKTYKSGKYDCKVMTLSALLDYRNDDNKESQFEISLFAESFREMIERNAAFTVYETLANSGDKDVEKKRREEAREKIVTQSPTAATGKEDENGVAEKKEAEKTAAGTAATTTTSTVSVEKIELKSVVANRTVYEAFSLFDVNLCGYLNEKDVEEILYSGEFGISRGQVQKLAKKLSVRDKINYRHLTDVLTDLDGNVRYTPGGADEVVETDDLMRGYGLNLTKGETPVSNGVQDSSDGLVVINGNAVNVPQKLKLLKQAEQERDVAKSALSEQTSLIEQLREAKSEVEKKKKDIESHYHKANKRLNETTVQLKTLQDDYSTLKQALSDCKRHADRIFGVVEKALPPPPKKEEKKDKEKSGEKVAEKKEEKIEEKTVVGNEEVTEIVLAEEVGEDEEKKEDEENEEKKVEIMEQE